MMYMLALCLLSSLAFAQTKKTEAQLPDDAFKVDWVKKRDTTVQLTKKAIEFLLKNRSEQAFHAFLNDRRFVHGDIRIFVYDIKGTTYVHHPIQDVWGSRMGNTDAFGLKPFDLLLKKAEMGGGWVDYESKGAYKSSYVEKVEKEGVTYLVGAGWFPMDKRTSVVALVKHAVNFFKVHGRKQAFDEFSNKLGEFVTGDLYIYVYDKKGYCLAHGDNSALIGRMSTNPNIKQLIDAAINGTHWVDYPWKNAPKVGYTELVSDDSGQYIIGSGFYPDSNRTVISDLVKRAVQYFNAWGREKAAAVFSYRAGEFVYGDASIFMYDFEGNVIANGDNPEYVGQNLIDLRSPDGMPIVRNLIDLAKEGGGWIGYSWKNDWIVAYVQRVRDKKGEYVIGAGFFPSGPRERALKLVHDAIAHIKSRTKSVAFRDFMNPTGTFIRGIGLELAVFNMQGDCLVYSGEFDKVWMNFKEYKDSKGQKIFTQFMQAAQAGSGWVKFHSKGTEKMAYIEKVEKHNEAFIICAAYYF